VALGEGRRGHQDPAVTAHSAHAHAVRRGAATAPDAQETERAAAGAKWTEHHLVFASAVGTPLDSHNVRRAFRHVVKAAGLVPDEWTPREMRHSFDSLLSASGVALEDIARLVGHSGTVVTETVYRKQIRPVIEEGAAIMDQLFPNAGSNDP
jgi:integrase